MDGETGTLMSFNSSDGQLDSSVIAAATFGDNMDHIHAHIGKTNVFLRAGQMAELDARRRRFLELQLNFFKGEYILIRRAAILCNITRWRGIH